jgi:hypothetical protein
MQHTTHPWFIGVVQQTLIQKVTILEQQLANSQHEMAEMQAQLEAAHVENATLKLAASKQAEESAALQQEAVANATQLEAATRDNSELQKTVSGPGGTGWAWAGGLGVRLSGHDEVRMRSWFACS